jgi:hypothetical protein
MKRSSSTIMILAAAIAFAACGAMRDSATAPLSLQLTAEDSLTPVAHTVGLMTVGDIDVLNSSASTIGFQLTAAPDAGIAMSVLPGAVSAAYAAASGCTLTAATGRFDCPPATNNGLTLTRSFAFYDANGNLMTKFNDSTTASVNVKSTESGVRPTATGADTVSRSRDMTASGLLGKNNTRTWNGTGSGTQGAYWADSAATRTSDVTLNTTFSNIVIQLPRAQNQWPLSGSITRQVSGSGTVTKGGKTRSLTISRIATITFNGTQFVPMIVGTTTYTLDLATGNATKN